MIRQTLKVRRGIRSELGYGLEITHILKNLAYLGWPWPKKEHQTNGFKVCLVTGYMPWRRGSSSPWKPGSGKASVAPNATGSSRCTMSSCQSRPAAAAKRSGTTSHATKLSSWTDRQVIKSMNEISRVYDSTKAGEFLEFQAFLEIWRSLKPRTWWMRRRLISRTLKKPITAISATGFEEVLSFHDFVSESLKEKVLIQKAKPECFEISSYLPGTVVRVCRLTNEAEQSSACSRPTSTIIRSTASN